LYAKFALLHFDETVRARAPKLLRNRLVAQRSLLGDQAMARLFKQLAVALMPTTE
jgi:hypothetical protein